MQRGAASHFSNSRRFLDFVLILLVLARNQNLFVFAQNQNLYLLAQNQNLFVLAQNQNLLVFIQIQNMFVLAQNQNLFVLAQKREKVSDKTNSTHGHTSNSTGFLHFFQALQGRDFIFLYEVTVLAPKREEVNQKLSQWWSKPNLQFVRAINIFYIFLSGFNFGLVQ